MKSNNLLTALILFSATSVLLGCNATSSDSGSTTPTVTNYPITLPNGPTLSPVTGNNVMALTVNGAGCSDTYPNKPCASVTVCQPGTSTCVTVHDILVDTGSYGLRIFKTALGGLTLPQVVTNTSASVAECVQFGDGSTDWGPVQTADVIMGNEPAVRTSIQVIDSTFYSGHFSCGTPDSGPAAAGFNGILGIGLFAQDCGTTCVATSSNGHYFGCSGSTCSGTRVALADQVQNPVALLPQDNNGVILKLPSIPSLGAASTDGYIIFGIGTQSNNTPTDVHAFAADPSTGEFVTSFNGRTYHSFIDSGSNGLFFPSGAVTGCTGSLTGWFCPPSQTILTAINSSYSGSPSGTVTFQVMNMRDLMSTPNEVFPGMAGSSGSGNIGGLFDWGLPFYLGRNVYLGIENTTSTLGTGPYWAY